MTKTMTAVLDGASSSGSIRLRVDWLRLLPLVALVLTVVSVWWQYTPPAALPVTAPLTEFSAARAMTHLPAIASVPRPVASAGHAATRNYLLDTLKQMGITAEVQATTSAFRFPGAEGFGAASVQNVLVKLEGKASSGAIVLNAHYDGGTTGPAAGDCGSCVITLLETLRALRAGPSLKNDVIFVFSDAEETGDHGAHAFATQHPWMRDVRLALNFEGMGSSGPASLYVTSPGNGRLIEAFAQHAPHALTSSLTVGLFNGLAAQRNACDLQDYLDAGSAGFGFVFSGDSYRYHTLLDTPAALDPRTVQHFGGYALALTRHFGDAELDHLRDAPDAVFFPLFPGVLARYPAPWSLPLALLAAGLFIAALAYGRLRGWRILLASLAAVSSVIITSGVVIFVWWLIRRLTPSLQVFLIGHYATRWYLFGLLALAVAVGIAYHVWLRKRFSTTERIAGALACFCVLSLLASALVVWSSYLFLWPLFAGIAAFVVWLKQDPSRVGMSKAISATCAVIVPALLWLPTVMAQGTLVGFQVRLEGLTGLPLLGISGLLTAVLVAFVLPFVEIVTQANWPLRAVTGLALLTALTCFAIGTALSGFSATQPEPSEVRYELDADRQTAQWLTSDNRLNEWSSQFIPRTTPRNAAVRTGIPGGPATFSALAPLLPLAAPALTVREDTFIQGVRSMRIHLASPRQAPTLEIRVDGKAPLLAATIAGQSLKLSDYEPAARGQLWMYFTALPAEGVELHLQIRGNEEVRITLADTSDGLPSLAQSEQPMRPITTMPTPGGSLDGTIVRRTVTLARRAT